MLKVCIVGLSGRMGHVIFDCCQGMEGFKVISGISKNDNPLPLSFNGERAATLLRDLLLYQMSLSTSLVQSAP